MVQMAGLGAILALRDKSMGMTINAIMGAGLTQPQFNIVKQLANAYDRTLAKQI